MTLRTCPHAVVVVLYCWCTRCDAFEAAILLARSSWARWLEAVPEAERSTLLEDLFNATPASVWTPCVLGERPSALAILRETLNLTVELELACWVSRLNTSSGLTPTSSEIWQQRLAMLDGRAKELGLEWLPLGEMAPQAARPNAQTQWATRWRKRWAGELGKLKTGSLDSVDKLRLKAIRWGRGAPWERVPGPPT